MTIDNVSTKTPELVVKDNRIQQAFTQAAEEMGVDISFEGFYNEDSNARAKRMGINTIMFNEKFLDIPQDELQRVGYHEIQHVENTDISNTDQLWGFTFTDQFKDIHNRMLVFYKKHLAEGSVFEKRMYENVPKDYNEMALHEDSYDHWDELLAHLKAYEIYLRQKAAGVETTTQPYEFLEAFKPEDLRLLDKDYRQKMVESLGKRLKDIKAKVEEISISMDELSQ